LTRTTRKKGRFDHSTQESKKSIHQSSILNSTISNNTTRAAISIINIMGNNNCTLGIRTEQQSYAAGSQCNGRIYLSVNQDFIPCHALRLHFKGFETAVVHHDDDNYDRNTCVVIEQDHVLHPCTSHMNITSHGAAAVAAAAFESAKQRSSEAGFYRGQYEFPFQFVVPHDLPSSMHCRQGQSKCEIRYELRAYLQRSGGSTSTGGGMSIINPFQKNYSSQKITLTIYGNPNQSAVGLSLSAGASSSSIPAPIHFPTEINRINFWCCFNRGHMHLEAQLQPEQSNATSQVADFNAHLPTLQPNTPYTLTYHASNQSTVAIESIRMELVEVVSWKPRWKEEKCQTEIVRQSMDGWVLGSQGAGTTGGGGYVPVSPSPSAHTGGTTRMEGRQQEFRLIVPNTARDTCNGRMIQVHHFLRIKLMTACCITAPKSSIDVQIVHLLSSSSMDMGIEMMSPSAPLMDSTSFDEHDAVVAEATTLPGDWSPQTADVIALPVATAVVGVSEESYGNQDAILEASIPAEAFAPSAPQMEKII
jgi:hypothetical protein